MAKDRYIPALRFQALTPLYDTLLKVAMREDQFKAKLVQQVGVQTHHRVLDLGCGTGTLTILLKQSQPNAEVIGLDGDSQVLAIARKKAQAAGVKVQFLKGVADVPPFEPGSFQRIVSSLFFHHLSSAQKLVVFEKTRILLSSDGELHVADWGKAQTPLMRALFLGVQLLDGVQTTQDNVKGLLPNMMKAAGFHAVEETHQERTVFGSLSFYKGLAG